MIKPKICIVDDHELIRYSVRHIIENNSLGEIIGEYSNGKELLKSINNDIKPDIVFLDIDMPELDGIETSKILAENYSNIKVVILTMLSNQDNYIKLINLGVNGFISKNSGIEELRTGIEGVINDDVFISSDILKLYSSNIKIKNNSFRKEKKLIEFSKKEREIFKFIASGLSNLEISKNLDLSIKTLEYHKSKLFNKTGCRNSICLILFAIKNKIIAL